MPLTESAVSFGLRRISGRSGAMLRAAHPAACCQVLSRSFTVCGSDAPGYKQGVTISIIPSGWLYFSWHVEGKKSKLCPLVIMEHRCHYSVRLMKIFQYKLFDCISTKWQNKVRTHVRADLQEERWHSPVEAVMSPAWDRLKGGIQGMKIQWWSLKNLTANVVSTSYSSWT